MNLFCVFCLFVCFFVWIFYSSLAFKIQGSLYSCVLFGYKSDSFGSSALPLVIIFSQVTLTSSQNLSTAGDFAITESLMSASADSQVAMNFLQNVLTAELQSFLFFTLNKPCKFFFFFSQTGLQIVTVNTNKGFLIPLYQIWKSGTWNFFYTANLLPKRFFTGNHKKLISQ